MLGPGALLDGRYRIERRLGSGTMGVVYAAEDVDLARAVAIKIIDPASAHDPLASRRFLSEARSLARVRHPNVVQVHAFGTHESMPFFVMEYVAGTTLESLVDERTRQMNPLGMPRVVAIVKALAAGLDAVHAEGMLHRDVKPGNVVIEDGTGRPVLIDFGLARKKSNSMGKLSVGGTPSYMAPEQAMDTDGSSTVPESDLYALACIAFELVTSRPLFDGKDVFAILTAHLKAQPPLVAATRPELAALDAVLARALAKKPEYRHRSCSDFAAAFEAATLMPAPPSVRTRSLRPTDASRVLLLEPDAAFGRQLVRAAERGGCAVDHVLTADELFASLDASPVHGVVVDAERLDGRSEEILRALRSRPGSSAVRLVAMTRSFEATLPADLGVTELSKPLNMQVFVSVLQGMKTAG